MSEGANEFVYGGCPANGYAQMSITLQAKAYGAKATFFMAKRSMDNLHEYQKKALEYGVIFVGCQMVCCKLQRKEH